MRKQQKWSWVESEGEGVFIVLKHFIENKCKLRLQLSSLTILMSLFPSADS
jgi:hypothetical protein